MKYRKLGGTVRRNVTMAQYIADNLEMTSNYTGRSQSEILEIALNQPMMRRLYAFVNNKENNPLVSLIEVYQESAMEPRIGETILSTTEQWFMNHAVIENREILADRVNYVNSYICGHMTEGSKKAHPYFKEFYEEAKQDMFITEDISETELKCKMMKYFAAMLSGPLDKNIMGESYLFRNLLIILSQCFKPPIEEEIDDLFYKLSDGRVLPYYNNIS